MGRQKAQKRKESHMNRALRILKSEAARKRRKKVKELKASLTERLYKRLRKQKKKK